MTVHTIELSLKISPSSFRKIRKSFFEFSPGYSNLCFEDKRYHRLTFSGWASSGITAYLSHTTGQKLFYYLRLRINPSKLLGNHDPTALFSPTAENIALLGRKLVLFLDQLPASCLISDFSLYRVDLCQDHILNTQAELLEYLRLLKTGASPFSWKLQQFGDERDNHSFRCRNNRYQVTAYDKLYEIRKKGHHSIYESGPIFRLEIALFSPGIRYLGDNGHLPDSNWLSQLLVCGIDGSSIMEYVLRKLLPLGDYFTFEGAQQVIQESYFPQPKRNKLCAFLVEINCHKQINTIAIKSQKNGRKRLQQLCELNISPCLLDPNTKIPYLPSLFPSSCI